MVCAMGTLSSISHVSPLHFSHPYRLPPALCCFNVRSSLSLPLPVQKAKYQKELQAAVDAVEKSCRLCVDVKASLLSSDGRVLEKNDNTPVTVADFGVQALISLELGKLSPDIPLVAEEDSAFLRSRDTLVATVVNEVTSKASPSEKPLTQVDVLEAIDRGKKNAVEFRSKPATYWVLDPIDGTRGFLKSSKALYVVGLAFVVDGEIVLGVMGCPNWKEDLIEKPTSDFDECFDVLSEAGVIMIAHIGCGTWTKRFSNVLNSVWTRCFVDGFDLVQKARFCIPDSQTWESLPLYNVFHATNDAGSVRNNQILLLQACCGSLCKYLMVASGKASVFILRAKEKTTIKAWDHAVGMICVHEAGGKVTDWEGREIDLSADQIERRIIFPSGGVLVTNNIIHDQILQITSQSSII